MSTSTLNRCALFLALHLSLAAAAFAQSGSSTGSNSGTNASPDCIKQPDKCDLNATISEIVAPDSPAFAVLGLNSTNTSKPNSPAELAASALNAFDANGHFQSGTAIDAVPFLIFKAKSFSLGTYVGTGARAYAIRLLARTSVSFATTKGTSSPDTSVRLATGLRVSVFDLSDPRALFQRCAAKIDIIPNPNNPNAPTSEQANSEIAACRKKAKGFWNGTSLVIAGAPSWISTDGSTSTLKRNGGGYWASFGYGFGTWGQIIVNARRQTAQSVVPPGTSSTATNAFVLQDTTVAGGAFKFGRSDFNGIVEGLYIGKRTAGVPDSYPEFGFGLEKKLVNNVYLELNYRYDVTSKQTSGVLANLKWSFSRQAQLAHQ